MSKLSQTRLSLQMRRKRVRSKIHGTAERPRLSVHISLNHISAQLINDDNSTTILFVTTVGKNQKNTMTEKAVYIGKELGKKAKAAKIKTIVFDRGEKLYHGRIKALADAARSEGLEF